MPRNSINDRSSGGTLRCPECGSNRVSTSIVQERFRYGRGEDVPNITVSLPSRRCDDCGLEYFDHLAERCRHEAICRQLGVLTPAEIVEIRKSLGLSRKGFAKLTRLGTATLARWERGLLVQNPAYDQYLRLLVLPDVREKLGRSSEDDDPPSSSRRYRALGDLTALKKEQADFQLH